MSYGNNALRGWLIRLSMCCNLLIVRILWIRCKVFVRFEVKS